ncbi:alanine--tRNA ligase [Candidatus Woesearchaeota archaeon]|nr:alanine--tRNA ligase [Candidatus Woesearchaeota archaeon]
MVKSDKEIKKWFKGEASKQPEKYYATTVLEKRGYVRKHCACGTWFWTMNKEQKHCGDAACAGGFTLFEDNPCKKEMDYIQTWNEFAKMFDKKGYAVVPRYPVVARWNPTMDFTIASIAAFQPYVVSGEVEAPSKKLVIPQFCLRFGDVDNVGITMSHMTGFVMIGQHAFVPPDEWDQDAAFADIVDWLTDGLGLPYEEITFHEDAWAGGGNFGPCMEYFSRGVELGNQVYMLFEQDDEAKNGYKELSLKVLDMGMGHERNAWFSQGRDTIYDATFPTVIQELKKKTKVVYDEELMHKYIPYAAFLNLDEVEDINEAWELVSKKVGVPVEELREKIGPMVALYSIAEHARTLLFALADGALPSNVGGGYNLRMVYRRAQGFIDQYGWDIDMGEVAGWHADYLKPLFPELKTNVKDVKRILDVEKRKYVENKKKGEQFLRNQVARWSKDEKAFRAKKLKDVNFANERLIHFYDTQGIPPETAKKVAKEEGIEIDIPDNFYALVAERHEQSEQKVQTKKTKKLKLDGIPNTEVLYYKAWDYVNFKAPVMKVLNGNQVVLERTAFYPTSGGQENDIGTLNKVKVVDVFKQDGIIVHVLKDKVDWKKGNMVEGKIDIDRRLQLAQHHTAAHIINGAAKKVLGNHIWQAGAAKTTTKARLDITHYDTLSEEELQEIERVANVIVQQNIPLQKDVQPKNLAEAEYGFRLYQGGAVPGKEIRVVDIPGFDTEACGGTHLNTTGEAGYIRILRSTKVQDGIIRIEFTAGLAAEKLAHDKKDKTEEIMQFLGVKEENLIPAASERLFLTWKKTKKLSKKKQDIPWKELEGAKLVPFKGEALAEAAHRLQTQPEHVLNTLTRFKKEIDEIKQK